MRPRSTEPRGDNTNAFSTPSNAAVGIAAAGSSLSPDQAFRFEVWLKQPWVTPCGVQSRSAKEVAADLGVSDRTVRHYLSRAMLACLRLQSRLGLDNGDPA